MTEKELQKHGYEIVKGDYVGTSDDNINRWYLQTIDGPVDHRGRGYPSKQFVLDRAVIDHGVIIIND